MINGIYQKVEKKFKRQGLFNQILEFKIIVVLINDIFIMIAIL